MGAGCSSQANEAVVVDPYSHPRRRSHAAETNHRDGGFGTSSFLDAYHAPSPRLLQYLASNNVLPDEDDDDDESSTEDNIAAIGNTAARRRSRRLSGSRPTPPLQPSRSTTSLGGLAGLGQRRRQRRRRQEDDVRFAEVLALQQSLAAMEDFFQSLLSHSHLLLEVMDPPEGTTMGGPPPASQAVLSSLPRRRWGDVQQRAACKQPGKAKDDCCCDGGHFTRPPVEEAVEEGTECGVCFEPHQDDDLVIELPCGHVYHVDCVEDWLQRHCTCPTCRYELPTDDLLFERGRKERMKGRTVTTSDTNSEEGLRPTANGPSNHNYSATLSPLPSNTRMRHVMNESPSSWFIDHLQSRVEEDPPEEYYGRYDYRTYQIRAPLSTSPVRPIRRFPLPPLRPTTPPAIIDTDIVVEPPVVAEAAVPREELSNIAFAAAAMPSEEMTVASLVTHVDAFPEVPSSDEAKRPAVTHFPQQDTCAGVEGLDSLSSYSAYGRAGAAASTVSAFAGDSDDDAEFDGPRAPAGVKSDSW